MSSVTEQKLFLNEDSYSFLTPMVPWLLKSEIDKADQILLILQSFTNFLSEKDTKHQLKSWWFNVLIVWEKSYGKSLISMEISLISKNIVFLNFKQSKKAFYKYEYLHEHCYFDFLLLFTWIERKITKLYVYFLFAF